MIDRDSFKASYELEYAYIGKNVEYINYNAFKDCYNLQTLVFPQGNFVQLLEDAQKSPEWRSNYVQMTGQKT